MSLNWTTIKMYLTPPLTPPFQNGGIKSFDELIDIHEQARGSLIIQAALDLKLGKYYLKKSEYPCPLHSPTCKHVVLCPSGFE